MQDFLKPAQLLRNHYLIAGVLILLIGVGMSLWIALTTPAEDTDIEGSSLQVIAPGDSKTYRHKLERFGGKAAVMADDLKRWVVSWFEGRRLALLIALGSAITALGCFRAGWRRMHGSATAMQKDSARHG